MLPSLERLTRSPYFNTYLNHLESDNLLEVLDQSKEQLASLILNLDDSKLDYRYAEGKWSIKELVHHCIETELIFNYRALRIARENVSQDLPGFEENQYVSASNLTEFSKKDLLEFLEVTRKGTKLLYKSFKPDQLTKIGKASGWDIQVEALFYITAGHTIHHAKVLKERYL